MIHGVVFHCYDIRVFTYITLFLLCQLSRHSQCNKIVRFTRSENAKYRRAHIIILDLQPHITRDDSFLNIFLYIFLRNIITDAAKFLVIFQGDQHPSNPAGKTMCNYLQLTRFACKGNMAIELKKIYNI